MRRCLAFVSCLLLVCMPVAAQQYAVSLMADGVVSCRVEILAPKASVSGVCMAKGYGKDGYKASFVNEFGVSALDFTVSADRRQVRLIRVISFMDHWYVKRTVRKDLAFLFSVTEDQLGVLKGKRVVERVDGQTLVLRNQKYHLSYHITPINQEEDEVAE